MHLTAAGSTEVFSVFSGGPRQHPQQGTALASSVPKLGGGGKAPEQPLLLSQLWEAAAAAEDFRAPAQTQSCTAFHPAPQWHGTALQPQHLTQWRFY